MHPPLHRARILPQLLPLVLLATIARAGGAAPGWRVVERDDDPVSGYVLSQRVDASGALVFRLEATLDVPPRVAAGASRRMTLREGEVEPGRKRRTLRREGDRLLSHVEVALPFVADRDAVLWFEFLEDEARGVYAVTWTEAADEGPPPRRGVIRMPHLRGRFVFLPDGRGTRLVYESEIALGGRVPDVLLRTTLPARLRAHVDELRGELAGSLASR